MNNCKEICAALEEQREITLRKLGQLDEDVLFRPAPKMVQLDDDSYMPILWPSMALGRLKIVFRPESVLLVSDGLSDPFDEEIYGEDTPEYGLDFEAALEVPYDGDPEKFKQSLAESWIPQVLWAATDYILLQQLDVVGLLSQFGMCSLPIPPVEKLDEYICDHGFMCGLIGMPLVGDEIGQSVGMGSYNENPIFLLPIKLLTPDEFNFIIQTNDASNSEILAKKFLANGERHLSWKGRKSVLK